MNYILTPKLEYIILINPDDKLDCSLTRVSLKKCMLG